jgi:hypothetical protein
MAIDAGSIAAATRSSAVPFGGVALLAIVIVIVAVVVISRRNS